MKIIPRGTVLTVRIPFSVANPTYLQVVGETTYPVGTQFMLAIDYDTTKPRSSIPILLIHKDEIIFNPNGMREAAWIFQPHLPTVHSKSRKTK